MSRSARLLSSLALLLPITLLAAPASAALPTCDGTFHAVDVPNTSEEAVLYGTDGVATNDVWAAGIALDRLPRPELLHWRGSTWRRFPVRDGSRFIALTSVDARTANDAWAVGEGVDRLTLHGVAVHWDGTNWTQDRSPGASGPVLTGVAAVAADDVWATGVGFLFRGRPGPRPMTNDAVATLRRAYRDAAARGLRPDPRVVAGVSRRVAEVAVIRHFDGTRWTTVAHPAGDVRWTRLNDVDGTSSGDVWAVGTRRFILSNGDDIPGGRSTLIEHFDGSNWTHTQAPAPGSERNSLYSVDAVSADDAWAVGFQRDEHTRRPLVLHYDGSRWSVVPTPGFGRSSELLSVSAAGPNDVWATGEFRGDKGEFHKLIEHFDGSTWSVVHDGYPGTEQTFALATAAVGGEVWWVGARLTERFDEFQPATSVRC
jgi:hypothetical protein